MIFSKPKRKERNMETRCRIKRTDTGEYYAYGGFQNPMFNSSGQLFLNAQDARGAVKGLCLHKVEIEMVQIKKVSK